MGECFECEVYSKSDSCLVSRLNGELTKLEKARRSFRVRKNQIILTVGQPITGWYCIRKGQVRLYRVSRNGKEQTYDILGSGQWLGYREIIQGTDSIFNAVSLKDSELCFIPSSVWPSLTENQNFNIRLMEILSGNLRKAEDTVFALGTKKLHARLAELLLNLSSLSEDESISITREMMSTMLGSTTESIVRALTDFKDRKWVRVEKSKIFLSNREALTEVAQFDHN